MHALLAIVPLYLSRVQLVREALPVALPLCRWGEAHVGQHAWPMCLHDPSIDNRVSPTIARTGCWECPTVQDMLAMLRAHRNASLLDIGANIGYYSLAAAASGAAARVNAFEASPRNVLMLQQSVSRSRLEGVVTVHAMALGAAPGLLRLGVSKKNQGGLHHLEGAGGTQVARVALDSVLPPATEPVFVKMDVEGAECAVVRGMHSFLRDSALIIGFAMEVSQSRDCCGEWCGAMSKIRLH